MIIAVDFDGTIVRHEFPHIGESVPGAFHWMRRWIELGARLILWTMRDDDREYQFGNVLQDAVDHCKANGVEFWGVNCNPDQSVWSKSPKVYANVYIDDAAYGCPLILDDGGKRPYVDWSVIGPYIEGILLKQQNKG